MNPEEAHKKLTGAGLKSTQQRISLLMALGEMTNHPTAEEVYNAVKDNNPGITMATVYNILDKLANGGLVKRVFTTEGIKRYDPKLVSHGHIFCDNTNEIYDFYDSELNELIVGFFKKKKVMNIRIKNINLNISADKIDPQKEVNIK